MEEGKDSVTAGKAGHARVLPFRFLKFLLLFLVLCFGFSIFSFNMFGYLGVRIVLPPTDSSFNRCLEEPRNLEAWVKAPSSLLHTMNDTELLWQASFVPRISKYPFRRVPKIAFMFLVRGPLPLAPLWERFFKGHGGLYSIYIHSLPSYKPNYSPTSVFYRRQIPSQVAEWGRMSMCDAERRLLANALLDLSNEWFILLSEACIPLRNFTTVYHHVSASRHSFMGSFDENGPYGRGRYDLRMLPEVRLSDWRKGSQWFEVSRELAVMIVEDTYYYPKFEKFCRPACYVDEHYFPTMLTIKVPGMLANRTLTWVDWSRGGAHPAAFGKADIKKEFFEKKFASQSCTYNSQPSSLCLLFARKFSPSALAPLLEVSSEVFGF